MRILITAGGTREYIDPVRYISNASTGKMGYALARAALKAAHNVTLITCPTALRKPTGAMIIDVVTAADMFKAVKENFDKCDCLIMAAAVSDYTIAKPSKTKIKKQNAAMAIDLKPTKDILKWASKNKTSQLIVGFALEDKNLRQNAEKKLKTKKLDMIVANPPAAIASQKSTILIKTPNTDWQTIQNAAKSSSAKRIIRMIESL
ncbi:MAG: phosphopantothenoylcysteine decarboxylase [Anaerohalosphaera sp.]|nr:phosphopantothenoylcysteine decarboxylase [Anaerohalosphaera sp.]